MVPREVAGKGSPEGRNWRALPDEDKDDGKCEGYDEDAAVHKNTPELDYREDSVLEEDAIDRTS